MSEIHAALRIVMSYPSTFAPTFGQSGLVVDICGAALLAWGFFRQSDASIDRAARPTISEIADIESLVLARSDAKAGLVLLTIGFAFQGIGTLAATPTAWAWIPTVSGSAYALIYLGFRKRWVKKKVVQIRRPEEQQAMEDMLDQAMADLGRPDDQSD